MLCDIMWRDMHWSIWLVRCCTICLLQYRRISKIFNVASPMRAMIVIKVVLLRKLEVDAGDSCGHLPHIGVHRRFHFRQWLLQFLFPKWKDGVKLPLKGGQSPPPHTRWVKGIMEDTVLRITSLECISFTQVCGVMFTDWTDVDWIDDGQGIWQICITSYFPYS